MSLDYGNLPPPRPFHGTGFCLPPSPVRPEIFGRELKNDQFATNKRPKRPILRLIATKWGWSFLLRQDNARHGFRRTEQYVRNIRNSTEQGQPLIINISTYRPHRNRIDQFPQPPDGLPTRLRPRGYGGGHAENFIFHS